MLEFWVPPILGDRALTGLLGHSLSPPRAQMTLWNCEAFHLDSDQNSPQKLPFCDERLQYGKRQTVLMECTLKYFYSHPYQAEMGKQVLFLLVVSDPLNQTYHLSPSLSSHCKSKQHCPRFNNLEWSHVSFLPFTAGQQQSLPGFHCQVIGTMVFDCSGHLGNIANNFLLRDQ